jgi:hypothetical protein
MFASAGFFVARDENLMPATEANPAGHWENMNIWRANEHVLHRLGGSWFDPPPVAKQLAAREWAMPTLRAEVQRIIAEASGAPIAIKDPRIGVMMTLWDPIIADHFHPVLVIRDPVEIARSLYHRDGTPFPFALSAWELHMAALLDYLDGQIATVAPYASLTKDSGVGRLIVESAEGHIEPGRANCVTPADASGAFELGFHRNHSMTGDHDERLTSRQLDLWRLLSSLSPGDQTIEAPTILRQPSAAAYEGVREETERAQLVGDLANKCADNAELETKLASECERATALATRLAHEQDRANSLVDSLASEQKQNTKLSAELAVEHERANAATAAHLRAEGWLAAIQGSVSWRVTEPLRTTKGMLHRQYRRTQEQDVRRFSWLGRKPVLPAKEIVSMSRHGVPWLSRRTRRRSFGTAPCEIHVPISPTEPFFTKIHYLVESLRHFGGVLADSPVIVTVGGDEPVDLARLQPWSRRLGVEWRWLDDSLWQRHGVFATALQRFCYEIEAPSALLLDADTLFVQPIDDLLEDSGRNGTIAGVVAHVSPFIGQEGEQSLWERIFNATGLVSPVLACEHSGWQVIEFDPARRYCPPYFNLGFLFAQRDVFSRLAESIYSEMETIERVHPTLFRCQLALTTAIVRSGVDWRALPMRFNFPNIPEYLPRHQVEFDDVRIIHYLKDEEINRAKDFASPESVGALLSREDLNPINLKLRETLRQIHERVLAEA